MEKPSNTNNIIIDEVIPHAEALQMTSYIIVIDVKLPHGTNTKDNYDVVRHIHAILVINNMLDVVFHLKLDGHLNVHLLMVLEKMLELAIFSHTIVE